MAMDVGGGKGSLKADINVTPLVDVMLVLLIIMMLVAPMVASAATPFLRSLAVRAEARWMARRTVSTRSSRLRLPPASCWN